MRKILVLNSEYTSTIDAIISQLKDYEVIVSSLLPQDYSNYALIVGVGNLDSIDANVLICHQSLLPPFTDEDPVKTAMLEGVKVTGITIYWQQSKKIIAQYPIFIDNNWHYDDLKLELQYLEQSLFPLVIEKILLNEIVDMKTILKPVHNSSCTGCSSGSCTNGGCSNCSGCSNHGGI